MKSAVLFILCFFLQLNMLAQNSNLLFTNKNIEPIVPTLPDPDINFWLDGDDAVDNSGNLQWVAKNNAAWNFNASSGFTVRTDLVTGHKVVELDAQISREENTLNGVYADAGRTDQFHTIFMVCRKDQARGRFFTKHSPYAENLSGTWYDGYALGGRAATDGNYAFDGAHNSIPLRSGKLVLCTYVHKASVPWDGIHLFLNSNYQNSMYFANHEYNASKGVSIGDDNGKTFLAELLIYDKVLDDATRSGIEKYLIDKWELNTPPVTPVTPEDVIDDLIPSGEEDKFVFWLDGAEADKPNNQLFTKIPTRKWVNQNFTVKTKNGNNYIEATGECETWADNNINFKLAPYCVIIVAKKTNSGSAYIKRPRDWTTRKGAWRIGNNKFTFDSYNSVGGSYTYFGSIPSNSNWNIISYKRNSGKKLSLYVNSQLKATVNDNVNYESKHNSIFIAEPGVSIAEIIVFNVNVSDQQLKGLELHLKQKWGL